MINFFRSAFTWKEHPWKPDPIYKWKGGFVGEAGESYQVRFNLESRCQVVEDATETCAEFFLGSPCRSEYTIAKRNLFQVPSSEYRMVFSRKSSLIASRRPSNESEPRSITSLAEDFQDYTIDIRTYDETEDLATTQAIVDATLSNDVISVFSTYRDRGFTVTVEYPVNLININAETPQFQVCTGPVLLPDVATWNGEEVERVFVADVAISALDWVEFILRREVAVAAEERTWLDQPRGRDRLELVDPNNIPPGYPTRPKPSVFNETWEMEATNVVKRALNV